MMTYADTSVLVAWFHPEDEFALLVTQWIKENVTELLWNPLLRLEVRHNLRKIRSPYARVAWNALRAAERTRLRLGREKLQDLLDEADDLSATFAYDLSTGTWDLFHVAAAIRLRAESFATCDHVQATLAKAANLPNVKLFKL